MGHRPHKFKIPYVWFALAVGAALLVCGVFFVWILWKSSVFIAPIVLRPQSSARRNTWHQLAQHLLKRFLVGRLVSAGPLHFQKVGTAHVHDDDVGNSFWGILWHRAEGLATSVVYGRVVCCDRKSACEELSSHKSPTEYHFRAVSCGATPSVSCSSKL